MRLGAEGSQFVERRHLSLISGEGGLQPIVCCQSARSGMGLFQAVSLVLFLTVSPGVLAVVFGPGYPECEQGIVQDNNSLFQSSQVARINC